MYNVVSQIGKYETWRREYNRGATGKAVQDARDRRRRKYAEYDPFKAQDVINDNNANKGTGGLLVLIDRRSRRFTRWGAWRSNSKY